MIGTGGSAPFVRLTCLDGDQCSAYFEPWGTEFILPKGDVLIVRSEAFATGDVEISYLDGGISLAFTRDVPIDIVDGTGRNLFI